MTELEASSVHCDVCYRLCDITLASGPLQSPSLSSLGGPIKALNGAWGGPAASMYPLCPVVCLDAVIV